MKKFTSYDNFYLIGKQITLDEQAAPALESTILVQPIACGVSFNVRLERNSMSV